MIDFSQIKLSPGLKYTLKSMPRGKNYSGTIVNSCAVPNYTVTVDSDSNCILCGCDGWLPIPVGKVLDFASIEDVLNSPIAKMLQDDIEQKKFTWCAVEHCGIIHHDIKQKIHSLNILIDDSCNLYCPSCRRDSRMITDGPEYDKKIKDMDRILTWLEIFDQPITISLGGHGDPLASFIIRNFIKNYHYRPNQKFTIGTNGLLLKKVIADSAIKSAINHYNISIDAGTKEVYENVRRPGKWEVLLENLEWLAENRQQAIVRLNFVLQKDNFQDLLAFANVCEQFDFIGLVQPLNDWGTWNSRPVVNPDEWTLANGTYLDHDVLNPTHPEHMNCIQVLNNFRDADYKFINLHPIFNKFK